MPETDILNPTWVWDASIEDSMNPDYGFTRKRASTLLHKKAVGGTPWTRETQNTGHVFTLSWLQRSWLCAQRLKQYDEQYRDGYFTIVDWDGGGRQYVGRFTTEIVPVETGFDRYDIQNVTFEEMPTVPMVSYPSDWNHDSVILTVANDFGDQKLATNGTWSQAAIGAAPSITLGGFARTYLPKIVMTNPGTTAGDWATYEYRGYGFKLWMCTGPEFGQCDVYLDNVKVQTVDCYAAADTGPVVVLTQQSVSLDIHDVQVAVDATKNASASAPNISWYALQVMR